MLKKSRCLLIVGVVFAAGIAMSSADPDAAVLEQAQQAYRRNRTHVPLSRYLTLIDYSKPVFATRLWVVDLRTNAVVLRSHVSHALNSGLVYATEFSNVDGSEKSCLGSFVTSATYSGRFGYSLKVIGLDAQNTNTLSRHIVFHPHSIPVYSQGCWMTSPSANRKLINLIKGGSFVYVAR